MIAWVYSSRYRRRQWFDLLQPKLAALGRPQLTEDELLDPTPRQRWGTCCPHDPECEHSFLEGDALTRWMDTPISNEQAAEVEGG